jgi:hypothetical protein
MRRRRKIQKEAFPEMTQESRSPYNDAFSFLDSQYHLGKFIKYEAARDSWSSYTAI